MKTMDVPVTLLWPIRKSMAAKGLDWEAFCAYADVDNGLLSYPDARIETEELERIMQSAADYTKDSAFGLRQGQAMQLSDLGVLGYAMLHSKTIGDALAAYQKYNDVVCGQYNAEVEIAGDEAVVRMVPRQSGRGFSRHCIEDMTASLVQIILQLSGKPVNLTEASFSHARQAPVEAYAAAFGGVIPLFGQEHNALAFRKEVLDYPVLGADSRLFAVFEGVVEDVRKTLVQGLVLSSRLREWILSSMSFFFPSLQDAAKEMRMSARTLQARLKEEGTTYNRLANEVRRELAIRYLARPEHTVTEIAYLLHFSEPSSFHAAFKKWTGKAPGEYRAENGHIASLQAAFGMASD